MNEKFRCIYCKEEKIKQDFDSEHVLPQAFGLYGTDTITLVNMVCKQCNQDFGNSLDLALGRETLEGLFRFNNGVKPLNEYDNTKYLKGQKITAIGYPYEGMSLIRREINGELKNVPEKDVAFPKPCGSYDDYYLEKIPDREELLKKYPDLNNGIKIFDSGRKEETVKKLSQIFGCSAEQIYAESESRKAEGDCLVEFEYTQALRGIAKSAFNFFAHCHRKQDRDILFADCFDPIRNYIRYGEGNDFIIPCKEPMIADTDNGAIDVHLVDYYMEEKSLWVSISFHNKIHWRVCLSKNFTGNIIEGEGCYFDPHNKSIGKIKREHRLMLNRK